MTPTPPSHPPGSPWSIKEIRDLVQRVFNKRPCWFQIKVALALHAGKDVVACAPTGSGKTLSFWIPLLMALEEGLDKMTFVVTPLNLLGKQTVESLGEAGISAIAVSGENNTAQTFKDIENGKYRVVTINPEVLMNNPYTDTLWRKSAFTKKILNFIFDEGHCISQWGSFRREYLHIGALRYLIPDTIPFYVPSATLPPAILLDISEVLHLRVDKTEYILCSNDRPEISLVVRGLKFSVTSFKDLAFVIPEGFGIDTPPPPKFLIFFDNRIEAENACLYLRTRLPTALKQCVKWFHSLNTGNFREEELENMRNGEIWGFCCTDSFGMGMDVPGIELVIQWKANCSLCTLWQRFGRAARGAGERAIGILLVEKKDTTNERTTRSAKSQARKTDGIGTKRKAVDQLRQPSQRRALVDGSSIVNQGSTADNTNISISEDVNPEEVNGCDSGSSMSKKEERRVYYSQLPVAAQNVPLGKGKRSGVEVGTPMDDFINDSCDFGCRREVAKLYFGNDKAPTDFHLLCNSASPTGCDRCRPRPLNFCCDLCNPDSFPILDSVTLSEKPTRATSKSYIKAYTPTQVDKDLHNALYDWRDRNAILKFEAAVVRNIGSFLFLSNEVVARIVDCAHAGKLTNVADLRKETTWKRDWIDEFGGAILELVHEFYPPPNPAALISRKRRAPSKCSACGMVGHNSANRACPRKMAARLQSFGAGNHHLLVDENIPPPKPLPR